MVTKAEFLFMIQSVNLPPSAHTITSSAHCSTLQPSAACSQPSSAHPVHTHCNSHYIFRAPAANLQCTLQLYYPVHTTAILSSAHCSYIIQCTLQLYYPVHTVAISSSAHYSYTTQCTLQLHYLVLLPYSASSAPLDHHSMSLYHYWPTSRAVSRH